MRRVALVLVVILLVVLLLVVPVGMGAAMGGMPCSDCLLSSGFATACFALLMGLAAIIPIAFARQRVASVLAVIASQGGPRIPERPPR
jgi:hypothetical protein